MNGIFLRFCFVISLLYIMFSYISGGDYQIYLLRGVFIFIVSSFFFICLNYIVLKFFADAKLKVVMEDFIQNYNSIKILREERLKELKNKCLAEHEAREKKIKNIEKKE